MRGKLNAHRLFRGTTGTSGYLDNLDISAAKERSLREAREIVRDAIPKQQLSLSRLRMAVSAYR